MATLISVNVQSEDSSKPKGFSPQTVNAQVGDAVFWHNDDQKTQHQPTPDLARPDLWGPPIPGQNSSSQINLGTAGTISYQDALQPNLAGRIVVATPVVIGQAFGGGNAVFSPSPVQIAAGAAVSWTNSDSQPHQPAPANGPANAWLAQPIQPGQKSPPVSQFPNGNVTVQYRDALNPSIQGVIQVNPAPAHRWTFGGSGPVAQDLTGKINGTISSTATRIAPGPPGQAGGIHLDGSESSKVTFPVPAGQFGAENFSVALWLRTRDTLRYYDIVGNRTAGSHGIFFSLRMTGNHETQPPGQITAEIDQNGQNYIPINSSKSGYNDGNWHHVTVVRNGASLKLYVDGGPSASGSASGVANVSNNNPFVLGRSLVGVEAKFTPVADYGDLRIYNVALTDAQVQLIFNNTI